MQNKLLKTSLFGFSKTDVCEYIAKINEEFSTKIDLIHAEHNEEKAELLAKIASLTEELEKHKKTNSEIAQTLLDTQRYAEELKEKSKRSYQKAKLSEQREKADLELITYRDKFEEVRKSLAALLAKIDPNLATQAKQTADLAAEYNSEEGIVV